MKKTIYGSSSLFFAGLLLLSSISIYGQEPKRIQLPAPQFDTTKSLYQALKDRKSSRSFSTEKLPMQTLSNLLWAGFGINRPETGGRTAPSARNWQEFDIYVAIAEGLFLYDAKANSLNPILAQDVRQNTGSQPFVKEAPVNLIFVGDSARAGKGSAEAKGLVMSTDAGFISQNVYLYCASAGLATVVRGSVEKKALAELMKLRPEQAIFLAQTVGFPKK
jgi:SagB-type dehydrogenase family enzyme